jgi:hypothetical protein
MSRTSQINLATKLAFSVIVLLLLLLLLAPEGAHARNCRTLKAKNAWKHQGGTFRKLPRTLTWVEYDGKGIATSEFTEELREGDQVVITSQSRGISLLLRGDLAGIRNRGEQNFQQLYQGHWMKMVDCTGPDKDENAQQQDGPSDGGDL